MRITEHFDSSEFDVNEPWPGDKLAERMSLALLAEAFRLLFGGRPARITSAFRNPTRNASVGGVDGSEHTQARALDVNFIGITDAAACRLLLDAKEGDTLPRCGQVIVYAWTSHIHFSLPRYDGRPNGQLLYAYKANGITRYRTITRELVAELERSEAGKARRLRS